MGLAGVGGRAQARSPRAYAVCAAVTILVGCVSTVVPQTDLQVTTFAGAVVVDPTENGPNIPTTGVPGDFFAERRTWGDMCPSGPCGTLLVVGASGAWTWRADGNITQGRLSTAQVENHDGTSVGYAWTMGGVTKSVSSCHHPINDRDSLTLARDRSAAKLAR